MDIQTEVQKIHHQYGVSEKANYETPSYVVYVRELNAFNPGVELTTSITHVYESVIDFINWEFDRLNKLK